MKSGKIAVIGRPNVGKSTLLNRLLNEKLAIVSPKPQTTWQRLHGILTVNDAQFIFIDTPGLEIEKKSQFASVLKKITLSAIKDAEIIMHIVEPVISEKEKIVMEKLKVFKDKPKILVINKIDLKKNKQLLLPVTDWFSRMSLYNDIIPISAKTGDGTDALLKELKKYLTNDGMLYDNDAITDKYEKELAAEFIREKIFLFTRQEVPYSVACVVDKFDETHKVFVSAHSQRASFSDKGKDREFRTAESEGINYRQGIIKIYVTIFVEKQSQKGIIIGNKGSMIKKIGTAARIDIEKLLGTKVYLELHVKVRNNWTKDKKFLEEIGLK